MGKSLKGIAKELKSNNKKVQLIYAFNGTGKTRLSREFKELVSPENNHEGESASLESKKILYYNAFTEDLFYWDNDLEFNSTPKLRIHSNVFTDWVFKEQGQERNVISNFQNYTNEKLFPRFNAKYSIKDKNEKEIIIPAYSEIKFTYERGNDITSDVVKISKGEESCFIWSVFYSLLVQVIEVLNIDKDNIDQERETDQFDNLQYVFIDDPVTSLDDNHLIQLAVDLADIITKSKSTLKFIITTHNPVFYNVLHSEINRKTGYMLENLEDGTFELKEKQGDSNMSFSYHLHLKKILEDAIANNSIERYHFMLLRNLYEKTASFLGYPRWAELLPDDKEVYLKRIIQFTSHSNVANESFPEPNLREKNTVSILLNHLKDTYNFWEDK